MRLAFLKLPGPAPEFTSQTLLNTGGKPLGLADLHGNVVIAREYWTFDCINCRRVIPALKGLRQLNRARGLVLMGDLFPEFAFEAGPGKPSGAVAQLGIKYPATQDNDG
jgi:hypothetical protein